MYLQHHKSQQSTSDKAKNTLFYALWMLYAFSAASVIIGIIEICLNWQGASIEMQYRIGCTESVLFACCDFIAQIILIYRCWIVWGYSVYVVIVPAFLAFAGLALWIALSTAISIVQHQFYVANWGEAMEEACLGLSMTVNALVTGLIVFRIIKVFQQVKTPCTVDGQILGVAGGGTLRRLIFVIIESGMVLFSTQLFQLVVTILATDAADAAAYFMAGTYKMVIGITPTIILVRVALGLSFHDQSSLVQASIGSLCFAPDIPKPIPEDGIVDEERRDDEFEIQLSDDSDIQMVDR